LNAKLTKYNKNKKSIMSPN